MPAEADTRRDTHPTAAVGGGADVPGIPELAGEQRRCGHAATACPARSRRSRGAGCPSRATRAPPKRRDAWLAEATAVTGTSAFRRSDMATGSFAAHGARRYACPDKGRHGARTGTSRAAGDESREEKTMKKSDIAVRVARQALAVEGRGRGRGQRGLRGRRRRSRQGRQGHRVRVRHVCAKEPAGADRDGNTRTGESVAIAASRAPAFKAGQALRDGLRQVQGGQGGPG